jgi:hypothetical protein
VTRRAMRPALMTGRDVTPLEESRKAWGYRE